MIGGFRAEDDGGSPGVRGWFGAGVPAVATQETVRALAARWMQIRSEREPLLGDFWHDPPDALANYAILFLRGDQDYTYVHHGRALRERVGFSMQGRRLGELRTRVRDELQAIYDRSCAEFEPAYLQSFADFQQDVVLWGRLCLPLRISSDDARTALLVYCHPIEDKASIFRALFEHAACAIFIAVPVRDELGAVVDAWIIAENARAARLTQGGDHASANLLLRGLPVFAGDGLWQHLAQGLDGSGASATLTDRASGRAVLVEAEAVDDYLVVRVTEGAGPHAAFTT